MTQSEASTGIQYSSDLAHLKAKRNARAARMARSRPAVARRGTIGGVLIWILNTPPPYARGEMLDNGSVYPVLWLQKRYPDQDPGRFCCPWPVLQAFARRNRAVVYSHAAGPAPHPFVVELAAYLDGLAAWEAIDAVIQEAARGG